MTEQRNASGKLTIVRVTKHGLDPDNTSRAESLPVCVVHTNRLFSWKYLGLVCHHTWLVKCRLAIENQHIPITKMSIDFLAHHGSPRSQRVRILLELFGSQKLVGDSSSLLEIELVLLNSVRDARIDTGPTRLWVCPSSN